MHCEGDVVRCETDTVRSETDAVHCGTDVVRCEGDTRSDLQGHHIIQLGVKKKLFMNTISL